MSPKTDIQVTLKRISEPVREKFPEMANSLAKLSDDKQFQSIVGHMGTIGGLINLGIYLYSKIKEDLKSDEEKYFAALMTVMFRSAKESLRSDTQVLQVEQVRNEEYIKELFVLFIKNLNWNSKYLPDHPAVVNFRRHIIEILAENDGHSLVRPFVTGFNYLIQKDSANNDPILVKFRDKLATSEIQEKLLKYLEDVLLLWEQPSPIDNKSLSSYYIENKAYELPIANWEKNIKAHLLFYHTGK